MSANRGNTKLGNSYNRARTRSKITNKKEQNKIVNYFSPKEAVVDQTNAGHGNLTNGLHPDVHDIVSTSEFNNTLVLSSPAKNDGKLQNGLQPSELSIHSVCTRSQSQKFNFINIENSPVKEPKIEPKLNINGSVESIVSCTLSSNSTKDLKTPPSSPISKESNSMDGSINSSPHTGPPTPHKIQALNEARLRLDSPLSPSALTKLKIISPRKIKFSNQASNAKRKLPVPNNISISSSNSCENVNPADKSAKPVINGALKSNQKPAMKNTQMTQFFPIRRSHRKPKAALLQEKQKEIEERILSGKEEGLEVECFGSKGRGVKTTRFFRKGEMVVEYVGDLVDMKEAKERDKKYSSDTSKGCYMYYFTYQNTQYCIDATEESGYLGRLVNHSRNGNLATKTVEVQGKPHLILLAKKDLEKGTEVLYDYGDRSKQSLEHHPWLAF